MKKTFFHILLFVSGFASALFLLPQALDRVSRDRAHDEMRAKCIAGEFHDCKQAYEIFNDEAARTLILDRYEKPCLEQGPKVAKCDAVLTAKYNLQTTEDAHDFAIKLCDKFEWDVGCSMKLLRAARLKVGATEIVKLTKQLCSSPNVSHSVYERVCEKLERDPSASWEKLKNIRVNAYYSRVGASGVYQQNYAEYLGLDREPAQAQ